jgi:hypothetical protein
MKSAPAIRLRSLTLIPTGGIGNRLRAIASARRLCKIVGARCSIIWDWGNYEDFFEPLSDASVIQEIRSQSQVQIRHRPVSIDPSALRTVDVTAESVELVSGTVFGGSHEAPIVDWAVLHPFIPRLNKRLIREADAFICKNFVGETVGMHIRRTDHRNAIKYSPDRLFIKAARKVIASGYKIFLATDNAATEKSMHQLFPGAILTFPKKDDLQNRWPRPFTASATEDDLLELFILSRTVYILGSYWSSYSYLAIVLNGSKRCEIIELKWAVRIREWAQRIRWWRQRHGLT